MPWPLGEVAQAIEQLQAVVALDMELKSFFSSMPTLAAPGMHVVLL
ncbi:MAG: hypothetical protein IPK16_05275 [Anaerolineales bacterium]|nr:hypothetical protein [Anaerolineales bacterium]